MTQENEIVPAGSGVLIPISQMKQSLTNVAASIRGTGGDPFLRLLKDGTWVYGAENIEVEAESLWAVNPNSLQHGWSCWSKGEDNQAGELLGEAMVSMFSTKPNIADLPQHGFPWSDTIAFSLRCVSGEDEGVQVLYKVNSKGGLNASRVLLQALIKQVDTDPANLVPILELQKSYYNHKTWGRTYIPIFRIDDWSNEKALAGAEPAEEPKAAKAEAPTVRRRNTAAAAPSPQPAAAARGRGEPAKPARAAAKPATPVRRRPR